MSTKRRVIERDGDRNSEEGKSSFTVKINQTIIATIIMFLYQMKNSVKPCFVYSLHWISLFWGAEESWQIQTVPSEYLLFMWDLSCAAESWRQRLNEISVPLEAGTVHVPPCFPQVKASFEVRSSRVLQPYCPKSLMCLSLPLLIRLIKFSLIQLTSPSPRSAHSTLQAPVYACMLDMLCYWASCAVFVSGRVARGVDIVKGSSQMKNRLVLQNRLSFSRVNKLISPRKLGERKGGSSMSRS